MRLRALFRREDDFKPGIYKHTAEFPDGGYRRMHLRVESDLNGIFWLNGNESFYLNETAAFFTWCILTGKEDREAKRLMRHRLKLIISISSRSCRMFWREKPGPMSFARAGSTSSHLSRKFRMRLTGWILR